jgi:hypothetical protein
MPADDDEPEPAPKRGALLVTRYGLPGVLVVLGIVLIVIGHGHYTRLANRRSLESAAGVTLLLIALSVWLINWMLRMSVDSTRDREKEEEARDEYARTGHWPDER